jgi:LPXTG-motif cell wall-anchored protein
MICHRRSPFLKGKHTMVRRSLTIIGLAFAALIVLAPAASAQYNEPGTITTDDPNPDVGDSIVVNGTECDPGPVTVTISQGGQSVVVGQFTAGADGTYTGSITVPNSFTAGSATISDSCGNNTTITIGGVSGVTLPRTGSSSTGTLWRVAVALLAAGGVLVLSARKRSARVTVNA